MKMISKLLTASWYQIRVCDLMDQKVIDAIARTDRPCRIDDGEQISMFSST